jgi:rhamnosyltransferase
MNIAVIIPTYNAGDNFGSLLASINEQNIKIQSKLIIDSESNDRTIISAIEHGFAVHKIIKSEFNHGATRQLAVALLPDAETIVFLTQDVALSDDCSILALIHALKDEKVGAAYGRQLPRKEAGLIEAHARQFNYPKMSRTVSLEDVPRLGLKAAFLSDSFAAYRRDALLEVGGFPARIILGEDMVVGAKLLSAGWKIAYCAEATAYHSHPYGLVQEFSRYFDTGVMHERESWLIREFGGASGEGIKFVRSEFAYLWQSGKAELIPLAFFRTIVKYLGYQLGRKEKYVPLYLKKRWSMNKNYWNKQ